LSPPKHIPSFKSIKDPFNGISETFSEVEIKLGLDSMKAFSYFKDLKLERPEFF
jgi:hypothetical protein